VEPVVIEPDDRGRFTLSANDAELHGEQIRVQTREMRPNIGFWDRADEWPWWKIRVVTAGAWRVSLEVATAHEGAGLSIEIADQTLSAAVPATGGWDSYRSVPAGVARLSTTGEHTVVVRPASLPPWKAVSLRAVRLTPVD